MLFRSAWPRVFDFGTSNRQKFIFDFMGGVALKSSTARFGYGRSRLFLIAGLVLTGAVINS